MFLGNKSPLLKISMEQNLQMNSKNRSFLLPSSKTIENSSIIDNIHQSIIDLEYDPPETEIQQLLEYSITCIDKNFNENVTEEIISLILSCLSHIPNQKDDFFKNIYENSQKSAKRLILFAAIFSQSGKKLITPDIENFISNISEQILKHIENKEENLILFDHEIPPKFKINFICNIILMMKLTKKNISDFYSYILIDENVSKQNADKLIKNAQKLNSMTLLSEEVFVNEKYHKLFWEKDLFYLQRMSKKNFNEFLPLLKKTFTYENECDQSLAVLLLDKCIEFGINIHTIYDCFPFIFDCLNPKMMKPSYWNFFLKNDVTLSENIIKNIEKYPDPKSTLLIFSDFSTIPIDVLAKGLLEIDQIHVFERLINYDFDDKECEIFSGKMFWIHVFSVVSFSGQKYSDSLLSVFAKIFEKFVIKKNMFHVLKEMIFDKFPTTNAGNQFLYDILNKFSSDYKEGFDKRMGVLLSKIFDLKKIPLPSFWKIFDYDFIANFYEENKNIIVLYAYCFSNPEKSTNYLKKIFIHRFKDDSSQQLILDFIQSHNDLDYLAKMNIESLVLIIYTFIYASQKEKPIIVGLKKETILHFLAILFNFLNQKYKIKEMTSEMKNLLIEACKYSSMFDNPLMNKSIDSILSNFDYLKDLSKETANEILDIFCDQLIDGVYKADKAVLLKVIFNQQHHYNEDANMQLFFQKYGISLFHFVVKNISQIDTLYKLERYSYILYLFDYKKVLSIANKTIEGVKQNNDISINTAIFLLDYCVDIPSILFHLSYSEKVNEKRKELIKNTMENLNYFMIKPNDSHFIISSESQIDNIVSSFQNNFKNLMKIQPVVDGYLRIQFEKIGTTSSIKPITFLENYFNLYGEYNNDFINAINRSYHYDGKNDTFVNTFKYKFTELKFSIFDKLLDEANKNSTDFQPFFLLQNFISTLPFLFTNNDIIKMFPIVLQALDSFSLYFTINSNSDEKTVKDVKKSLSAFYFLHYSLYSVKILEEFMPWLYKNIKRFTISQILSISFILISLFDTKGLSKALIAISSKYNISDIFISLLKREVPNEISSYYNSNLTEILDIHCQNIAALSKEEKHQVFELKDCEKPFHNLLKNFLTIYPNQLVPINLPKINNNEMRIFIEKITEIRSFWIHYNRPIFKITETHINYFFEHFCKIQFEYNDDKSDKNSNKSEYYYYYRRKEIEIPKRQPSNDFYGGDLISFVIKNKKNSLISEITKDEYGNELFLNFIKFSPKQISNEMIKNILLTTFNQSINFDSDKFKKFLIDFTLSPEIRNDSNFVLASSIFLKRFENFPNNISLLIGFLLTNNKKEFNYALLDLLDNRNLKNFPNLYGKVKKIFHKEIAKRAPSAEILAICIKLHPVLITIHNNIPLLLDKILYYYDTLRHKDDYFINVIIRLFNKITPERKEQIIDAVENYDDINFSLTKTVVIKKTANEDYNESFIISKPPDKLVLNDPTFWNLYSRHLSALDKIIRTYSRIFSEFTLFNNYPELLSFEMKADYFHQLVYSKIDHYYTTNIDVHRSSVLTDSYEQLHNLSRSSWLSHFNVHFINERGIDAGGLTKEWFTLITKEIFNPNYALFIQTNNNSYQPNPLSGINYDHLNYFEFFGKIVARALIQEQCINAHFLRSFCRQILHRQVKLKDLEDYDSTIYNSVVDILRNDADKCLLTFSIGEKQYDQNITVLLKENGDEIDVNNENKYEFVSLLTNYKLRKSIINQINAFCEGFNWLIPHDEIKFFSPSELDLLICGIPEIDVNDLKKNTRYDDPYNPEHPVIKMFFNVISKWKPNDLAMLLLFFTGSSQVPVNGFRDYAERGNPITLAYGGDHNRLCAAHTCFNTLDLPEYQSEEELNTKLLQSITESNFDNY